MSTAGTSEGTPPPLGADNYLVGRQLARGGMGSVMEAADGKLKRTVAIKLMLMDADDDEIMRRRFLREAEILALLEHPNIVPIHDLVWEDGQPLFYSMKLVKGRTLQAILDDLRRADPETRRDFTLDRLLLIFRKACGAISFAHSKQVIHRDIKPENIMIGEFGEVLVMDWGIAKRLDRDADTPVCVNENRQEYLSHLGATLDGAVIGTPQYMSPEQAQGQIDELDERSDIYSLGSILYAILTLRPPVEGATADEVLSKVKTATITPPVQVRSSDLDPQSKASTVPWTIPPALSSVAMKALQLDKAQRYPTVLALSADIEAHQSGFATSAEQAGAWQQLKLLLLRNKILTASLAVILLLSVGFVLKVMASERRAVANEQKAIAEKQAARQAMAKAQIAMAEVGVRAGNGIGINLALSVVPEDLRSADWHFFKREADTSIANVRTKTDDITDAVADPTRPSVFAVSDRLGQITILNVRTGEVLLEFTPGFPKKASDGTMPVAFSPDGRLLAIARTKVGGIVIHDARTGKPLRNIATPPSLYLEFGNATQLLRHGGNSIEVWNAETGDVLWKHVPSIPSTFGIRGVFTPDHEQVLTYCDQDRLEVRSARDGSVVRKLGGRRVPGNWHLAVHPDGKTGFTCSYDGTIECVRLLDGKPIFQVRTTPGDKMTRLTATHDQATGDGLLIAAYRATFSRQIISVWNARTGALVESPRGGQGDVASICVHPLSDDLLVVGGENRVWNLTSQPMIAKTPSSGQSGMAFWGTDDLVFSGSSKAGGTSWGLRHLRNNPEATLWSPASPRLHRANVSADGRIAAIMRPDFSTMITPITLLRQDSAEETHNVKVLGTINAEFQAQRFSLSPTGKFLAAIDTPFGGNVTPGKTLAIYDTTTGLPACKPDLGNIFAARDIGWLQGDRLVCLVTLGKRRGDPGSSETIVLIDAASGTVLRTLTYGQPMDILAIAPDGKGFAVACTTGNESKVRIRDGETLEEQQELRVHYTAISAIAWHPTKAVLAVSSIGNSIRLWDLATTKLIKEWRSIETPQRLLFSPTGKYLISESNAAAVGRIWQVE